jgi:hypothetical protein
MSGNFVDRAGDALVTLTSIQRKAPAGAYLNYWGPVGPIALGFCQVTRRVAALFTAGMKGDHAAQALLHPICRPR